MLSEKDKLLKRLSKIQKELDSLAWKEYDQGIGTMRRAKTSRRCDGLAIEKRNIKNRLFDEYNIEI